MLSSSLSMTKNLCSVCGKTGALCPTHARRWYCRKHLRELVERRVRKDLRIHSPLSIQEPYYFVDDNSPLAQFTKEILLSIFDGRLRLDGDAKQEQLISTCLEQDVSEKFERFLTKRPLKEKGIRPLRLVSCEEIAVLTNKTLSAKELLHPLIYALEEKQKGTVFSFAQTFISLEKENKNKEEK